jgi:methyl-accepting chemotaxis protein
VQIEKRARVLFDEHLQGVQAKTDRMFALLLAAEWLLGILFAVVISPRTWSGTESSIHPHLFAAVFLGGALISLPIFLIWHSPGTSATRQVTAVSQMLMSGLLIHLTGGRIETHFHVFGSLAFLGFYRDWRVLLTATLATAVDHLLRGIFYPQSVYGVLSASIWRTLEHAGWVIFEVFFLILAALNSLKEMTTIAERQASMEHANEELQNSHARVEEANERLNISNASLDAKHAELSQTHDQLDGTHAQLRPTLHSLSQANGLLQAIADRLQQLIHKQNSSVQGRTVGLTSAISMIENLKRKRKSSGARDVLRNVLDATGKTRQFSLENQKSIEASLGGLEDIGTQMQSMRTTVSDLAESTRKITSITDRVEDFADQSNLLALNAAIEAARAGEAGRGFAVVAQAIRELADRSLKSTHEIRQTLTEIEGAIAEANKMTMHGNERMGNSLQAIRSSSENLRSTTEFINMTGQSVATVTESLESQSAALDEVSEIIVNLEIADEETLRGSEDLKVAATELNAITARVQETMKLIQQLESKILPSHDGESSTLLGRTLLRTI